MVSVENGQESRGTLENSLTRSGENWKDEFFLLLVNWSFQIFVSPSPLPIKNMFCASDLVADPSILSSQEKLLRYELFSLLFFSVSYIYFIFSIFSLFFVFCLLNFTMFLFPSIFQFLCFTKNKLTFSIHPILYIFLLF